MLPAVFVEENLCFFVLYGPGNCSMPAVGTASSTRGGKEEAGGDIVI